MGVCVQWVSRQSHFWRTFMEDLIWIAVTIAFFALSIGYVHFCDRVK